MMKIEPILLTGHRVRLEPLRQEHAPALYEALSEDPDLWRYLPLRQPRAAEQMEQVVRNTLLISQERTACMPFVIVDLASERVVGETRYLDIMVQDMGLEIGSTWLAPSVQRSGVNTECKYLLLTHAFEQWHAIRVQLKTHHLNMQSQQAIERLGAVKEGILRNCKIMPDGSYRHSVYYSIIDSEWPSVKAGLEARMRRS